VQAHFIKLYACGSWRPLHICINFWTPFEFGKRH